MTISVSVHDEVGEDLAGEWDRLAVTVGRPFSAPAWALAWRKHVAPADGQPNVVAVHDGESLIGLFPLLRHGGTVTPMGDGLFTAELLAQPGREAQVAAAIAESISTSRRKTRILRTEFQDDSPDWNVLIKEGWAPERLALVRVDNTAVMPRLQLDGSDFEAWLGTKSANFRRDYRRKARRLQEDGAQVRLTTGASLHADVECLLSLHSLRHPAGTTLDVEGVAEMISEVGEELIPSHRFRLLCMDDEGGETVAALLLSSAGMEVAAWTSGHAERYAHHSPLIQLFVQAVREMTERGEPRLNLGPGSQDYKMRIASEQGALTSMTFIDRGPGYGAARAADLAWRARRGSGGLRKRLGAYRRKLTR